MKPIISISLEELIKDLVIDKNLPEDLINVSEHKKKYSDNNKANLILASCTIRKPIHDTVYLTR